MARRELADELTREFQSLLVRCLVRDPSFLLQYRDCIDAAYFQHPDEAALVRSVLGYHDVYGAVPGRDALSQIVKDTGSAGVEELVGEIFDTPSASDLSFIKDRVSLFAKKRALLSFYGRMEEQIEDGDFEKMEEAFLRAAHVGDGRPPNREYFETARDRFASYSKAEPKVPTGFSFIDEKTGGGITRGEEAIIMTDTNGGKSMVLVNIAKNAVLRGYRTAYYTMELSTYSVERRMDMSITGLTKREIMLKRKTAYERLVDLSSEVRKQSFFVFHYPSKILTPAALRDHVRLLRDRDGIFLDLIIVDYGDLLSSGRTYSERRHELSFIFESLRSIGDEFSAAVWTATQLNREGARMLRDGTGTTDGIHVSEDYGKIAIADVVLTLNQNLAEKREGTARLHFAKNRDEEAGGTCKVVTDWKHAQVRDLGLLDEEE